MKKKILYLSLVLLMTISFSCREQKSTDEKIEDAVEETGESIENAAEEVGDEVEEATDGN